MARRRSVAVVTMGVLNIIVASLGLLYVCCLGLMMFVLLGSGRSGPGGPPGSAEFRDHWEFMRRDLPLFGPAIIFGQIMGLITALVLLTTGVGLLNRQNWARLTCVVYCIFNILLLLADMVFRLFFMIPAQERWRDDFLRRNPGLFFLDNSDIYVGQMFSIGIAVLCLVYAIVLLIILLLPRVAATFRPRPAFDRYEDDFDDTRRFRRDWDD